MRPLVSLYLNSLSGSLRIWRLQDPTSISSMFHNYQSFSPVKYSRDWSWQRKANSENNTFFKWTTLPINSPNSLILSIWSFNPWFYTQFLCLQLFLSALEMHPLAYGLQGRTRLIPANASFYPLQDLFYPQTMNIYSKRVTIIVLTARQVSQCEF